MTTVSRMSSKDGRPELPGPSVIDALMAAIDEAPRLSDLLDSASEVIRQVEGVGGVAVLLQDSASGQLRLERYVGVGEALVARLRNAETLSDALRPGASPTTGDLRHLSGDVSDAGRRFASLALTARGEAGGVLLAISAGPDFESETPEVLVRVARHLGPAVELARIYEKEQRRSRQLRTIGEVGRRLGAILSEGELLPETVRYVREQLGYESAAVLLADDCGGGLALMAASGHGLDNLMGYHVPPESIVGWTYSHGETLLANDVSREPRYFQGPSKEVAAELAVPIQVSGKTLGVLDVQSARVDAFDEMDVSTLQTVASQIGVALENARLFEATQRALGQTKAIQEITAAIGGSLDLRSTLEQALDSAMHVFGADRAAIFLLDRTTSIVDCPASRNLSDEYLAAVHAFYETRPYLLETLKSGLYVEDASESLGELKSAVRREGFTSMLILPLRTGETVVGSFVLYHDCMRRYEAEETNLAQTFANQAAIAIDHARLFEDTQRALQRKRGLQQVVAAINASLDLPTTLNTALDAAMGVFKADRAAVLLIQQPPKRVICPASRKLSRHYIDAVEEYWNREPEREFQPDGRGIYIEDSLAGPLVPELAEAVRKEGFASQLFLPLRFGGALRGMFVLYHDRTRRYDDEERSLAQIFADQAAIAIEHARLFEAERQAREQTAVILEATRSVGSSLQLDEVLLKAASCIATSLGQDNCSVWLLDERRKSLIPRCACSAGGEVNDFPEMDPIRLEATPRLRAVLQSSQPYLVEEPEDLAEIEAAAQLNERLGAFLLVPLMAYEHAVGWVGVPTRHPGDRFDAAAIELAAAIGRSAALAVENARLHEQSKHLAVSEERNRLARELHDSVTQSLFSMTLITQALPRILESDYAHARERVERLNELARGALAEMRALIFQLRPAAMEDEPLADALRKYAEAFRGRERVDVEVVIDPTLRLPSPVEEGIFRIAQEALNNVAKHAKATSVSLALEVGGEVVALEVVDDGVGFAAEASERGRSGLGITSMRERAELLGGSLSIETASGTGSRVRVQIPLAR